MSRTITVRLDPGDYETLIAHARNLGISPGTLARVYVWAGLSGNEAAEADRRRQAGLAALKGLAALRARLPDVGPDDVVRIIHEGREDLSQRTAG